jgi:UDP-2,3-diacylglucosamine pyrophosphatase LpxH
MSKVYPSIQGCPFRKIVKRERVPGAFSRSYVETLSCGHTHDSYSGDYATKRRCYTCKWEKEQER